MVCNAEVACNMLLGWIENLLTKLWRSLTCSKALISNFLEFVKLVEIAIVQLDDSHLSLVVGMHVEDVFILKDFLYKACFQQWSAM